MIPHDRPFSGRDLDDFRKRFGYTVDDMCFVCGLTRNRWFLMASKEQNLPIRDVPIAIMCRLIDDDESLMFVPEFIPPQTLLKTILESNKKMTLRTFSVLMGNNSTSANRWTKGRKRAAPTVFRLSYVVNQMIKKMGVEKAIDKTRDMVTRESLMRGVRDVFSTGKWVPEFDESKAQRVKPKVKAAVA